MLHQDSYPNHMYLTRIEVQTTIIHNQQSSIPTLSVSLLTVNNVEKDKRQLQNVVAPRKNDTLCSYSMFIPTMATRPPGRFNILYKFVVM